MANSKCKRSWLPPALTTALALACGCANLRNVQIESTPPGADVLIDGKKVGATPLKHKLDFPKDTSQFQIQVTKDRYKSATITVDSAEARRWDRSSPWPMQFTLAEIRREVPVSIRSNVEGSSVSIDNKSAGSAPLNSTLTFKRNDGTSAWNTVSIRVEKPPRYKTEEKFIKADDTMEITNAPINFSLAEIRREIPVEIKANEPGAVVSLESLEAGTTPLKTNLIFRRADGSAPWPSLRLQIQKEGFEYRPPGAELPEPIYSRLITVDEAARGTFSADYFLPVRFVLVPLRTYEVLADKVKAVRTNALSEVRPSEQEKSPSPMTLINLENPLLLSRISPVPDQPEKFVYSVPIREERSSAAHLPTDEALVGAKIVMSQGPNQITPMTQGRYFDLDPFVTADGQWIYFSSDRSKIRIIWRVPVSGRGGYTPITGVFTKFDTEPAVSPDGTKLAFTSRLPEALATAPPNIWIADADGKLPTQRWEGHSPAWSPDGKKIAFVSPDHKICIAEVDGGGNPTQLTLGDSNVSSPVWGPLGKNIIYACDKAINDLKQHNFDIWMMSADGTTERQLNSNGSFESSPAISSDGKYLYFFSNRGGTKADQETLRIFRAEVSTE